MSVLHGPGWQRGTINGATAPGTDPAVVRFGGSLLERSDWPELAHRLLDEAPKRATMTFVVGGGPVVEGIRQLDRMRPQPDELIHRLAIDGMGITARLFAATVGLPLVARPSSTHGVVDIAVWLAENRVPAATIPPSWNVTSDSLAAIVATAEGLGLTLAKSVAPPPPPAAQHAGPGLPHELARLSAAGWIDGWFATAAARLSRIGWIAPTG
jgi:hypothetical protein